jgi:hypothetical protein
MNKQIRSSSDTGGRGSGDGMLTPSNSMVSCEESELVSNQSLFNVNIVNEEAGTNSNVATSIVYSKPMSVQTQQQPQIPQQQQQKPQQPISQESQVAHKEIGQQSSQNQTNATSGCNSTIKTISSSNISIASSSVSSVLTHGGNRRQTSKDSVRFSNKKPSKSSNPSGVATSSGNAATHLLTSIKNKTLSASRLLVSKAHHASSSNHNLQPVGQTNPSSRRTSTVSSIKNFLGHQHSLQPIELETNIITNEKNSVIQEDDVFDDDDDDDEDEDDFDEDETANEDSDDEDQEDSDLENRQHNSNKKQSSMYNKSKSESKSKRNSQTQQEQPIVNSSLYDEDYDDDEDDDGDDCDEENDSLQVTDHVDESDNLGSFHRDLDEECYQNANRKTLKDKTQQKRLLKNIFNKITSHHYHGGSKECKHFFN